MGGISTGLDFEIRDVSVTELPKAVYIACSKVTHSTLMSSVRTTGPPPALKSSHENSFNLGRGAGERGGGGVHAQYFDAMFRGCVVMLNILKLRL